MSELLHIGTVELTNIPGDCIVDVPAKIDTGADGSSIWASDIKSEGSVLQFRFFGRGSAFYNDRVIETSAFRTTKVKNSFGHQEFRYKVKLKIQLGQQEVTAWFSLADRSRNVYPILIGKNILKNRFVVDVSKKFIISQDSDNHKVLIMTSSPDSLKSFFRMVSQYNKHAVSYDCIDYSSLLFTLGSNGPQVINTENGEDIAKYSLVYFKARTENIELATACAQYLRYKSRPFFDYELAEYISSSKVSQYMKLACFGLPVPFSIWAHSSKLKERYEYITGLLGLPFVLKKADSDRGKDNFLVSNRNQFNKILDESAAGQVYIAQEHIENEGFYRLLVLNRTVPITVFRSSTPHKNRLKSHLNKPAGGKNARVLGTSELASTVRQLAVGSALIMDRQIAGVDLVRDKNDNKWYILEVNNAPQICGGSFVERKAEALARFIDKELVK